MKRPKEKQKTKELLWLVPPLLFVLVSVVSAQQVVDRIIAVVNEEIILESDVLQYAQSVAFQGGLDPTRHEEEFLKLKQRVLADLIDQKILLARAREDSLEVSPQDMEIRLEEWLKQVLKQVGSETKLEEYYGYSMAKIKRDLRKNIADGMLVEKEKNKKLAGIKVSRQEVERFYQAYADSLPDIKESIRLSHILLKVTPGEEAQQQASERIKSLYLRALAGEDFAELARNFSDGPSGKKGGRLGWTNRGDLLKEYEEVAYSLKEGEISAPVKTRFGYHIIKLNERKGEKINTSHVLVMIKVTEGDENRVREEIQLLRDEIFEPEGFSELARRFSQDEATAESGGELGWFEVETMPPHLRQATQWLSPGEISQPVKGPEGYHLVKLEEHVLGRKLGLKNDWGTIEDMALNYKRDQELRKWLDRLRQEIYVDIKG